MYCSSIGCCNNVCDHVQSARRGWSNFCGICRCESCKETENIKMRMTSKPLHTNVVAACSVRSSYDGRGCHFPSSFRLSAQHLCKSSRFTLSRHPFNRKQSKSTRLLVIRSLHFYKEHNHNGINILRTIRVVADEWFCDCVVVGSSHL